MSVATPSTVLCVSPQVFHGTSTDVTVPPSSHDRLSNLGSWPERAYKSLNIELVRMMDRNWSAVVTLRKMALPTVDETSEEVP